MGGICRITLNKIKNLRHKIAMVKAYVVEYVFSNFMGTTVKRKKYPGNGYGKRMAEKKYRSGINYIKWNQSEDFESIAYYADTNNNGRVLMESWDTAFGKTDGDPYGVYADG